MRNLAILLALAAFGPSAPAAPALRVSRVEGPAFRAVWIGGIPAVAPGAIRAIAADLGLPGAWRIVRSAGPALRGLQCFGDRPVEGSYLTIAPAGPGRAIAVFRGFDAPVEDDRVPGEIDAAREGLRAILGRVPRVLERRLAIAGGPRLAACVRAEFEQDGARTIILWDARRGRVLRAERRALDAAGRIRIEGWISPGLAPHGPGNPPVPVALPGVAVDLAGRGGLVAGADGTLEVAGLEASSLARAALGNPWIRIVDRSGPPLAGEAMLAPGAEAVIALPPREPTAAEIAELNAYYGIERAREALDAAAASLATPPVTVAVNDPEPRRARYIPGEGRIDLGVAGRGSPSPAYGTIPIHEYGHHVIECAFGTGIAEIDYHEGMADALAALVAGDPAIGRDFLGPGRPLRRVGEGGTIWPSGHVDPHVRGAPLAAAFWELRARLAADDEAGPRLALGLWAAAVRGGPPEIGPEVTLAVLAADDDDGDLRNGTPHGAAIGEAFAGRGLAPPDLEAPPRPERLACVREGAGVRLGWRSPVAYDAIAIRRDGRTIATLGGSAAGLLDPAPPAGTHRYEAVGIAGDRASGPAACLASIDGPGVTDLVWDPTGGEGLVPGGRRIVEALIANGRRPLLVVGLGDAGRLDRFEGVWVALGAGPHNYVLREEDGRILLAFARAGGALYMEGGDTWAYDPPTTLHPWFRIAGVADGGADFGRIVGRGPLEGVDGEPPWRGETGFDDHLLAVRDAVVLQENVWPAGFATAVGRADGGMRLIGASTELGGFGPDPGLRARIMAGYLDWLGLRTAPRFVRGEVNGDGRVSISDVVAILLALYGGAPPPACPDAADTDDDGRLTVGDAIRLASALFASVPPPPPPFPEPGPDPTPDGLDCAGRGG